MKNENIASVANNFATSIAENVKQIIHHCNIDTSEVRISPMSNSMFMEPTSEEEIFNILNGHNINKGPGIDRIRAIDLKTHADVFTQPIMNIVNKSFDECSLPSLMKTAIVKPIYKNGLKTDVNNYRPISILPIIEKIIEEIACKRLWGYLSKNNIMSKNQYGFQKGKNINKLLAYFTDHLNQNLSKGLHSLVLFVDFSKAFDTLSHDKLLSVLSSYGVRGKCYDWFKDYLFNRSYSVKIQNAQSVTVQLESGVPQGSKLGPILFIVFINSIMNNLKRSKIFAYADDIAIIVTHKNLDNAIDILQKEFNKLLRWAHDFGLIINEKKTKIMHFTTSKKPQQIIRVVYHTYDCLHNTEEEKCNKCNTEIEKVDCIKYLGVYVDSKLKWHEHIKYLQGKIRRAAYVLRHLSYCSNRNVLKIVYFSLAESYFRYGISAWGLSSGVKKLEKMQKSLWKIIGSSNTGIAEFLYVNDLFKLTMIDMFHNAKEYKVELEHNHSTRRKAEGRFRVEKFQNTYGKMTLSVMIPTLLNELPVDLLKNDSEKTCKRTMKNYLLKKHEQGNI